MVHTYIQDRRVFHTKIFPDSQALPPPSTTYSLLYTWDHNTCACFNKSTLAPKGDPGIPQLWAAQHATSKSSTTYQLFWAPIFPAYVSGKLAQDTRRARFYMWKKWEPQPKKSPIPVRSFQVERSFFSVLFLVHKVCTILYFCTYQYLSSIYSAPIQCLSSTYFFSVFV